MTPSVIVSDSALRRTKVRRSSCPSMTLSASIIALTPALALHSATKRPAAKPTLSPLGWLAMRSICSWMIEMPPAGSTLASSDRLSWIALALANRP